MLTFYYNPLSPIAHRVWLALLEKEIPFNPVMVDLRGRQFDADFLALNPFHHVPVIADGNFRLFESLAILDYLEERYPECSLSGGSVEERATMKMIQLLTTNELMPMLPRLVNLDEGPLPRKSTDQLSIALTFLNAQLASPFRQKERLYFGGDTINLADIVVGATVPLFRRLGLDISSYGALSHWCDRFSGRSSFQVINPSSQAFSLWARWIKRQIKIRLKQQARNR